MGTIDREEARRIAAEKEQKYGLPEGTIFKMTGMESGFDGTAVSPKGARGYLQFMEPTARAYGVTIGDYDSEADGAARYMRDNLKKYGGNMDLSLADYNGGPKAAAALAKGKPYSETSGYLAKFYGRNNAPLSSQFTTGSEVTPNYGGPSASELYAESKRDDAQYGGAWNNAVNTIDAVGLGFRVDNSVYNWWQERGLESFDPNFKWTDENTKPLLEGIPEKHWGYILQSGSQKEAEARRSRMVDTMEKEAELARMGMAGFTGRLVGGLVDLPTLIAFVPGAGGEGLLTAGSRIANAARLGIVGAATNVAVDAATMKYRPTATTDDLYISGLMGLGLGGVVGGAINPKRIAAARLSGENKALADLGMRDSLHAQRAELTDWNAGRTEFNAKLDSLMPAKKDIGPDYAAIDRAISAGQTKYDIDPTVARVRDEIIPPRDIPTFTRTSTDRSVKGITKMSVSDLMPSLKTSSDDMLSSLATRLEGQLQDDIPVIIRKAGTRSYYDPAAHEIHLRADATDDIKLHEIAHAVTANKIRYGLENPTTAHGELATQLRDVFYQVKAAAKTETFTDTKTSYYLKNMDEFVAGIYSGKSEFIDFMARTKVDGGHTILSKAVEIIRKVLGMDPTETNALTHALGITDKLIDTPLAVKQTLMKDGKVTRKLNYKMEPGVDVTDTKAFKDWFEGSKVVDKSGNPLRVYHGSPTAGFSEFGEGKVGAFFSSSRLMASEYAGSRAEVVVGQKQPGVYDVFLDIKNPLVVEWNGAEWFKGTGQFKKTDDVAAFARQNGYDGAILRSVKDAASDNYSHVVADVYVVFKPEQIKSASGNRGTFDPKDANILHAPEGSPVDADTVAAANAADIPTVFGWGLGLEHKLGGAKAPSEVRELASKLFGTTVGYKDHTVVKANAWDDTTKWADSWAVELRKGTYPQFEDWLKKSNYKQYEKGPAFDEFGTMVSNYIRGIEGDYPPQVIKAGDHMRKTLAKVVDYINNPMLDEGGVKRGLTEVEVRDAETGTTELVGKLEKNDKYLPRKHDINKWQDMTNSFGRDAVEGWWARAYKAGREGVSDEAAAKFAKWYVRTVEEAHANRTQDLLEDIMRGTDKDALRNSLMMNGGFDSVGAQKIIDDMFPTQAKARSDAGRSSSLKHRNTIDETHTETWTRADGEKVQVGLNDFIHSNAFDVVEPYLRRTAGNVALAKHLDVYKNSDIDAAVASATANRLGTEFRNVPEMNGFRKDLKFAFDRIQGLPQEEFTALNKSMEMWRNFNVIRVMGGAVWNQATEMSQIVGSMGWKTTMAAVPELKKLSRDVATGKVSNEILDHLENTIGGVGSEYVARMDFKASDDWVRYKGDTKFNRALDQMDQGTKKLARGVLDYTGMTPLMIQQKRVHAVALVNHFVNTANGAPSKFLTKDRLAWMGMDEADYNRVLKSIKDYTTPSKGEYGASHKMDFDGWVKNDPESYSKFMTAIHRESRRVVQENDLASMIPIMGTTLGKTVFQFMNFSMHGWNKSLNFAMNHRDWTTLSTVLHGGLFASLAYMGRTMMSAQGMDDAKRQEFLEKRLATGQIVANSFGRISQASLLPNVFDTVSPYPLFSGMRTTSDLSSLASNPTYQALNGLISMKKLIRNGVSDEYQTTEKDVRTWAKLLPLNNVYPVSTFLNSLANDYPGSEEQQ